MNLTLYYVCKWHLGIKLVFQKQYFLYVTSFLDQSMALYFFQDQVQMAQPGIQGSPWLSRLLCQYFPTWTLNSTQARAPTTAHIWNKHSFSCVSVVIFPSGSILNLFPYTCKFSYPSISGLRPYQFPSSHFSTLFSQPLYFTFYHILLIFKTLFKNIRLPIHIELSSNIQQYKVLQKYGIIYTQTNSLFFLSFSDLIVNKWW